MSIRLSLVIPAYNETARLPPYLASVRPYLDQHYPQSYEVLVVDDGSQDDLPQRVADLAPGWPELHLLQHARNLGKGAAVRTGMLAATGDTLLFADADGATPIDQEAKLTAALQAGAPIAVGSRLLAGPDVTRRRQRLRGLAGRAFASFARWALHIRVRDTQCGFKMFRREAGCRIFERLQETRFLFDLEVLALADRLGYQVAEVPVNWSEIAGGHLRFAREAWNMFLGVLRLRSRLRRPAQAPGVERPAPVTGGEYGSRRPR